MEKHFPTFGPPSDFLKYLFAVSGFIHSNVQAARNPRYTSRGEQNGERGFGPWCMMRWTHVTDTSRTELGMLSNHGEIAQSEAGFTEAFLRCNGRCDAICGGGVRCELAKYHSQKKSAMR